MQAEFPVLLQLTDCSLLKKLDSDLNPFPGAGYILIGKLERTMNAVAEFGILLPRRDRFERLS